MSLALSDWILFDSNRTDTTNFHSFSQNDIKEPNTGSFTIFAEALSKETAARSDTGAKLLVEASHIALAELQKKKLDFATHFFTLLQQSWKALVLLHAIQNPFKDDVSLSIDHLTDNEILSHSILKNYDASVGILYADSKQLIFFQSGHSQLALLNKRYNCTIKKAELSSLSETLYHSANTATPAYQVIDVEKYQLEMIALLPDQYTASKTSARLKSNMLKIYRSLKNDNVSIDGGKPDNHLIILKKSHQQTITQVATKKTNTSAPIPPKEKPKKRLAIYSSFLLLSGLTASYFLWQVQAEEKALSPSNESKPEINQLIVSNTPEIIPPSTNKRSEISNKQAEIKQQNEEDLAKRKQEKQLVALAAKEAEARVVEENKRLQQKQEEQNAQKEALKLKALEEKRQAQEVLRLKLLAESTALKEKTLIEEKLKDQQKQQKLAELKVQKLQQSEESFSRSIEKDLEAINRHDKNIRAQQQAQVQKNRENQARLAKEKQAEKRRKEALIKQRRLEFENNQKRKKQEVTPVADTTPQSRDKLHLQNQQQIKQKEVDKKRIVAEELKRQQAGIIKAKEVREKVIQKTITHQLMNYGKTFNRHVVQLKQKNKALALLEKRLSSAVDAKATLDQKRLQNNKKDIEQRIDRLSDLYLGKLRKLCANKVIHTISTPPKSTKIERIALSVISQQLRNCAKPQTLSRQNISKTMIDRYLKN